MSFKYFNIFGVTEKRYVNKYFVLCNTKGKTSVLLNVVASSWLTVRLFESIELRKMHVAITNRR